MGFNLSALFSFPFSLSVIFIASWFYRSFSYYWASFFLIAVFFINVFLLPQDILTYFWLPGGASTTLIASVITFLYLELNAKKYKKILRYPKNMIFDRVVLKNTMIQITDTVIRKGKYLDSVTQFSKFLKKVDESIKYTTSYYYFLSLVVLLFVNFGYWFLVYHTNPGVIEQLKENSLKGIVPMYEDKISKEDLDRIAHIFYFDYSVVFTAVFELFTLFFLLAIVSWWHRKGRREKTFFFLSIGFFKLPQQFILFYISLLATLTVHLYVPFSESYGLILNNLILLFSILYFLQGISIAFLYAKVRYLPQGIILGITFLFFYFIPMTLVMVLASLFLIGLFDFAFDLRKKTLQFE